MIAQSLRFSASSIAIVSGALLFAAALAPASAQKVGVTSAVNETAERTPPGDTTRQVVIGDEIVFNELIETNDVGRAQVLMVDHTALTVGPNSSLLIDRFVYDPEEKTGDMSMTLRRGMLRFVGGRISKDGPVEVKTPVGVLGIRGGVALINVVDQDTMDVTFLFGDYLSIFLGGQQVEQMRRAGFKTRVTREGADAPWQVSAAELEEDMQALQGRPDSAGGLAEIPDESAVTLLTEGALPPQDFEALTKAINRTLGRQDASRTGGNITQTISEGQQQVIEDNLQEMEPPPPPPPEPGNAVVGFARQTTPGQVSFGSPEDGAGLKAEAVQTIQLVEPDIENNASSIAYDPSLGLYYGSQVGSSSYTVAVWDPLGTQQQDLRPLGIDARSWNYNPNTGNVELVTFESGLFTVNRDSDGLLLGTYDELIGQLPGSPTDQTVPSYNPTTNELYAYGSGGTAVSVLDRETGELNSTITLDLASAGITDLSSHFIGYDPNENVLIGTQGFRAYVFKLDGSFVGSSALSLATDGNFDTGYANGQLFLYNAGVEGFQGFDLFGSFAQQLIGATDGEGFFSVSHGGGTLQGMALQFMTGTGQGPDMITNPFNPDDPATYLHPDAFAAELEDLGVSPANAQRLAGPQIAADDFFALTYSAPADGLDPELESRLTVFAGLPHDVADYSGTSVLAFDLASDPNRFSRHAFSKVGLLDVDAPEAITDIDFVLDESATQTPLLIDLERGKVFLASKVAQGDFANYTDYAFQAGVVVGDFNPSLPGLVQAGGGEILVGGFGEYELSATQTFEANQFQTFGSEGDYAVLAGDAFDLQSEGSPERLDYAHVGQRTGNDVPLDNGDGEMSSVMETSQLFAAGYVERGDSVRFSDFAPEGPAISGNFSDGGLSTIPTPGTLTIDRTDGTVEAQIELNQLGAAATITFDGDNTKSAYLNDTYFGIGSQGFANGAGGFLVSGKATSPEDDCTCNYLHWGYWAYGEQGDSQNANVVGSFVAGNPTPVHGMDPEMDMPVSGSATYQGVAEAAWRGPSGDPSEPRPTSYASGDFNHSVDFATGSGNGTMDLNGREFASQSAHQPGNPSVQFAFTEGETAGGAGVGSFTGPRAENLGVVFQLQGADGMQAAGSIRAERGPIAPPVIE